MFGWLLSLLNPLGAITRQLADAYAAKSNAQTEQQRIAADERIAAMQAQRDVVIASAGDNWWSPRVIMGWCVAIYIFKIIVWDTVLALGVTPNPGSQVTSIVLTVIGFYFVTGTAERIANTLKR
jgi:hypothetical protein